MITYNQLKVEIIEFVSTIMKDEPYICLLYGSFHEVFNETTDLDLCVYADDLTIEQRKWIAIEVENLHKKYGLFLDSDMKYINKTAFCRNDIDILEKSPPFLTENGLLVLTPVKYNRNFLDSTQMRLRLLLNIFTTNSILIDGDSTLFERTVDEMYDILLSIISRTSQKLLSEDQIFERLLYDSSKKYTYKSYLGYNPLDITQCHFIKNNIKKAIERKEFLRKRNDSFRIEAKSKNSFDI